MFSFAFGLLFLGLGGLLLGILLWRASSKPPVKIKKTFIVKRSSKRVTPRTWTPQDIQAYLENDLEDKTYPTVRNGQNMVNEIKYNSEGKNPMK